MRIFIGVLALVCALVGFMYGTVFSIGGSSVGWLMILLSFILIGISVYFFSKKPAVREGEDTSQLTPEQLSGRKRTFYVLGVLLIAVGIVSLVLPFVWQAFKDFSNSGLIGMFFGFLPVFGPIAGIVLIIIGAGRHG